MRRESVKIDPPRPRTSFRAPNLNLHSGFKQISFGQNSSKFDITKFDVNKAQKEFMEKKIKKSIESQIEKQK